MAMYLVRAKPKQDLTNLRSELASGSIVKLEPFGETLSNGLSNAKIDVDGSMVWIEEDHCSPPLAMEREAVLDKYFTKIEVELIQDEQVGWSMISDLPKARFSLEL
jgi:hypothetical protein